VPYHKPIPDPDSRGKSSGAFQAWVQAEKFIQIILILPSAAFIGWIIGVGLDHAFHTKWISMAGIILGIIAGLVGAVRMTMYYTSDAKFKNDNGDNTNQPS
jgi:ATP synthase protein I